ncbi:phosphoprotein [Tuhoko virus 2]|uniref:Phosphoprotein n=1 Tax=Tuhoko virus 2 TaxID=798073 RepID=D8WJ30_9MONO|nr:phosphoprotein [Tuhoko virus 2]ADI80717.1 phosphoprotein [Tuhoko virus 2]
MDPSPSDEEISAWIDKGMDTVQHFISQPVNPQSSLGKNTIKSGNTKILIKSAEKKSKATKDNVTQESAPTPPPRDYQSEKKEVVRPKIRKTQGERPRPLPPIPQQEESIYEEVSREVVEEDQPLLQQQQAHVLKGKQKILSTSPVNQEPDLPTGPGGQGFKRGGLGLISQQQDSSTYDQGIDESLTSDGMATNLVLESGATLAVPLSDQLQCDIPALVENALQSAPCVKEILRYLRVLENRFNQMESKIDKIISHQNILTQIRNEQLGLKASMAMLEGMITSIKIMDPGVGPGATAAQAKKLFKEVPVVISGNSVGATELTEAAELEIQDLGRPVIPQQTPKKRAVVGDSDLASYKLTLKNLAKDCIPNAHIQAEFDKKISSIRSENDFKKIKREILRAAT